MRIISFSNYNADSNPLYASHKILKLSDQIALQNCLFVHDSLKGMLPICFNEYRVRIKRLQIAIRDPFS